MVAYDDWESETPGRGDSEHGSQIMLKFHRVNFGNVLNVACWHGQKKVHKDKHRSSLRIELMHPRFPSHKYTII